MKQRPRRYITDSEMGLIWDRWEKGLIHKQIQIGPDSCGAIQEIARAIDE
jgi:hypothetical protein